MQLPFGILNQSFRDNGVFDILRQRNKTIHARSIFTKGLLFAKNIGLSSTSIEVLEVIELIESLSEKRGLTLMQYATSFALSFEEINSVLIGVDTPAQLNEIVRCMDRPSESFELEILSQHVKRVAPDDTRPENGNSKILSSSILKDEVARLDGGHTVKRFLGWSWFSLNGFHTVGSNLRFVTAV